MFVVAGAGELRPRPEAAAVEGRAAGSRNAGMEDEPTGGIDRGASLT